MSIRIDGTNTTANPGITGGDADTGLQFGTDEVSIVTGGTEKVKVDSSGNLGIGTATPGEKLHISGGENDRIVVSGSGSSGLLFENTSGTALFQIVYDDASTDDCFITTSDNLIFRNQSGTQGGAITERMRIDNSGIVYIRRPSGAAGSYHQMDGSANYRIGNASGGSGNYVYLVPGGTSWAGTSDERLKTGLVEIQDGLSKVSTLRAVTGRYTTDPETESRSFLIAQDVAAVLPEAVDAADPEKLGLRYTDTIPLLVAALKESKERIETLETRLTALEGGAS
jgi:hypothetical protein